MSAYFNKQLQETVLTLFRLNVEKSSSSAAVSLNKIRTTYSFNQRLSADKYLTIFQFMKEKTNSDEVSDKQISSFLEYHSGDQLNKYQKLHMLRVRWGVLYFAASFFAWAMLSLSKPGEFIDAPSYIRVFSAVLWFGGALLFWFNRIYFPRVKEAIADNRLTLELCEYVYTQLPKRKLIQRILHVLTAVMLIAAVILIRSFAH